MLWAQPRKLNHVSREHRVRERERARARESESSSLELDMDTDLLGVTSWNPQVRFQLAVDLKSAGLPNRRRGYPFLRWQGGAGGGGLSWGCQPSTYKRLHQQNQNLSAGSSDEISGQEAISHSEVRPGSLGPASRLVPTSLMPAAQYGLWLLFTLFSQFQRAVDSLITDPSTEAVFARTAESNWLGAISPSSRRWGSFHSMFNASIRIIIIIMQSCLNDSLSWHCRFSALLSCLPLSALFIMHSLLIHYIYIYIYIYSSLPFCFLVSSHTHPTTHIHYCHVHEELLLTCVFSLLTSRGWLLWLYRSLCFMCWRCILSPYQQGVTPLVV